MKTDISFLFITTAPKTKSGRNTVSEFTHKSLRLSIAANYSCDENAGSTSGLDSFLGSLGEKLGFHDNWNAWESSLSKNLEEALYMIELGVI